MPNVTVTLGGQTHSLACNEGQERRVIDAAHYIDRLMQQVTPQAGIASEKQLLLLVSLMLADENLELRHNRRPASTMVATTTPQEEDALLAMVAGLHHRLNHLTSRIGPAGPAASDRA